MTTPTGSAQDNPLEPAAQWVTVSLVPAPAGIYNTWTNDDTGETVATPVPAFLLQELREVSHYEGPNRVVNGIDNGRKPVDKPGPYETRVISADVGQDPHDALTGPIEDANYRGVFFAPSVEWKPFKDL